MYREVESVVQTRPPTFLYYLIPPSLLTSICVSLCIGLYPTYFVWVLQWFVKEVVIRMT